MSGITMLTPELTLTVFCKSGPSPPYETHGFAYATQSYDTTLLKRAQIQQLDCSSLPNDAP